MTDIPSTLAGVRKSAGEWKVEEKVVEKVIRKTRKDLREARGMKKHQRLAEASVANVAYSRILRIVYDKLRSTEEK